jgi:hypothetical protein
MEVFSECWYCFSVLARAATDGKSRQQQFEELYSDDESGDDNTDDETVAATHSRDIKATFL